MGLKAAPKISMHEEPDQDNHRNRHRPAEIGPKIPNPLNTPNGCAFHKRCPYATERCAKKVPALRRVSTRQVACHYVEQFL